MNFKHIYDSWHEIYIAINKGGLRRSAKSPSWIIDDYGEINLNPNNVIGLRKSLEQKNLVGGKGNVYRIPPWGHFIHRIRFNKGSYGTLYFIDEKNEQNIIGKGEDIIPFPNSGYPSFVLGGDLFLEIYGYLPVIEYIVLFGNDEDIMKNMLIRVEKDFYEGKLHTFFVTKDKRKGITTNIKKKRAYNNKLVFVDSMIIEKDEKEISN